MLQVSQLPISLYKKTTDHTGLTAYPWRSSAGFKFESMGAMAFQQSAMNNNYILRAHYKDSQCKQNIQSMMVHGDNFHHDLCYKLNYDSFRDATGRFNTLMLAEFKLITSESLEKYGLEQSMRHIFKFKDGKETRATKFLKRAKTDVNTLNLLIIGISQTSSKDVVSSLTASVFGPIWCIAYLPLVDSIHSKLTVHKVVHMFDSFSDYAQSIQGCLSPQELFKKLRSFSNANDTDFFLDTFKLP